MSEAGNKNGLYGYARVGRYGLGHSLLAWARCWTWCKQHDVPMLAPSWRHIRIGPWLRGERDKRQYHRLFKFHDYITGPQRLWQLSAAKAWVAENENLDRLLAEHRRGVVVFSNRLSLNEETHFHEIIGHGLALRKALTAMTRPEFRPPQMTTPHIALHVRMGDFGSSVSRDALRAGAKNSQIPVSWYRDILLGLRHQIGNVPAIIYSDGSDKALSELLQLPNITRSPHQPSITDLLSIAQATVLISSGSGFSTWGSFLGQAPRICFPGQRFVRVLGEPNDIDHEPEAEQVADLSADFVNLIAALLTSQGRS